MFSWAVCFYKYSVCKGVFVIPTYLVPDRIFLRDNAHTIILPTLTGQMGVLTNHIPLLTGLDTGLVLIRKSVSSEWMGVVVAGGFALVNDNKVTILVNEAELGSVRFIKFYTFVIIRSLLLVVWIL